MNDHVYIGQFKNINADNFSSYETDNLDNVFRNNSIIETVDLSEFEGSNIVSMRNTFDNCIYLKSVILPKNMNNLRDVSYIFFNCTSLQNVNLRPINLDKFVITDMFHNNNRLENVYVNSVSEAFKIHDMVPRHTNINVNFMELKTLQQEVEYMKVQIEYLMKRVC
jgi:hypothetical protein